MIWLDPLSAPVRAAVVSGAWGKTPHSDHFLEPPVDDDEIDTIRDSLDIASAILTKLTGHTVHPAGTATEEYLAQRSTRRLVTQFSPVRSVVSLTRQATTGPETILAADFSLFQGSVYFSEHHDVDLNTLFIRMGCRPCTGIEQITLVYKFGSTITTSARRAVLFLANQIWLESNGCDECSACQLPERTTSVSREGIAWQVMPAADGANPGQTGLPLVDSWVAGGNPRQATRRPGVYDSAAPSGVVKTLVRTS